MNGPCLKDLDQASVGSPICLASYGYHDKAGGCAFVEQRDRKGKTGMTGGLPGRGFSNKSMLICIQGWKGGEPYGIAAHPDCEKAVPFQGLAELCLAIDGIASFPEMLPESTKGCFPKGWLGLQLYGKKVQEILLLELFARQHKSLQGRFRGRSTGGKHIYFRSALELMTFMKEIPKAKD